MGYVPENVEIFEAFTGKEYLTYYAGLLGIEPQEALSYLKELIDGFEMTSYLDKKVLSYSKGMKQKLAIIASFISKPKLLLLDEPFDGLDTKAILFFTNILKSFAQNGRSVLISSHLLKMLDELITRAVIISDGTIVFDGDLKNTNKDINALFLDLTNNEQSMSNEVINNLYADKHEI